MENSFGGRTDTSYIYGVERLSFDYENGCSGYYLYDPRGSVTGITNEQGRLVRSYRYDAFGNLTFGEPRYDNEYTYNGESYNPNIESQYLRARYYDVVNGNFLTEDSYLGNINEPLTLNRYNYCISNPLMYTDPSGLSTRDIYQIITEVANDSSIPSGRKSQIIESRIKKHRTSTSEEIAQIVSEVVNDNNIPLVTRVKEGDSVQVIWSKAEEIEFKVHMYRTLNDKSYEYYGMEYYKAACEEAEFKNMLDKCANIDNLHYEKVLQNISNITNITSEFDAQIEAFKEAYYRNKEVYVSLAEKTDIPPQLFAVIHYRESTPDYLKGTFKVYLHNGDPLGQPTVNYPKGKEFATFEEAALDAIKENLIWKKEYGLYSHSKDIVGMMAFMERYNGMGYYQNSRNSPYLYSGTNLYVSGKYIEEYDPIINDSVSKYDEKLVDKQIGAYLLLVAILDE